MECSEDVKCPQNTTLETLGVPEGYWRDSQLTSKVYECSHNASCKGSTADTIDQYCVEGNGGPRCEVCIKDNQYFSSSDGCAHCPSFSRLAILASTIAVLVAIILVARTTQFCSAKYDTIKRNVVSTISTYNLQAKMKIVVSFFQVINTLQSVYGVQFDNQLWAWMNVFRLISLDIIELAIHGSCIGSMRTRLIIGAIWPYFLIIMATSGLFFHKLMAVGMAGIRNDSRKFLYHIMYIAILILYLALPAVSNSIFMARNCESFITDDAEQLSRSYLVADGSIQCDTNDKEYVDLVHLSWILFACWPFLVPIVFLGFINKIHRTVRSNRITALADACRFLWRDYEDHVLFWDVVDMVRKLFLTGFIMFVDPEEGSSRAFRLIIATLVSSVYMCILAYARPYKRQNDLNLALVSNVILICLFSLGIVIKLCDKDDELCNKTIGLSVDSSNATHIAVALTASMVITTILSFATVTINTKNAPTIRLSTSGYGPNLEMEANIEHHAFFSHVWKSGQGKTHAIVQKLRLYIPGIKLWLDVDDLEDISALESSVANCLMVIIFYSEGYFESKNCRRELYAAVEQNKPILVLHDDNGTTVEKIREECETFCIDTDGTLTRTAVLDRLCAVEHILWLNTKYFSQESLKLVTLQVLKLLPYYRRENTGLENGLMLAGELGPVSLQSQLDILIYNGNIGCREIADEVITMAAADGKSIVPYIREIDDSYVFQSETRTVLFLYIDMQTILCDGVQDILQSALEANVEIIMTHERDSTKMACDFSIIMGQTRSDLVVKGLYDNIAVPLYPLDEYRRISLRSILIAMNSEAK